MQAHKAEEAARARANKAAIAQLTSLHAREKAEWRAQMAALHDARVGSGSPLGSMHSSSAPKVLLPNGDVAITENQEDVDAAYLEDTMEDLYEAEAAVEEQEQLTEELEELRQANEQLLEENDELHHLLEELAGPHPDDGEEDVDDEEDEVGEAMADMYDEVEEDEKNEAEHERMMSRRDTL
mmetsp:Transcript_37792/g.99953  ORF Transcript_37792/g.99953 Transcript_37792/m.99953 type:complete len:182 (+) Transcript_37792:146-691(+)